ncbi:MAG: glycosyltransferase [Muribaculaceae bacterium]|nr:glycosyltransferase [Muribaculaceae bacterium]
MVSPKVSVIIPVWNSEKYLKKCLDSVIAQTYKNLEIICVNDGSTDKSLDILNEYAQRDKRIIVVTQENAGVSAARNNGLSVATGDYAAFVDSDDWLEANCYELAIRTALKNPDVELVQWCANVVNSRNADKKEYKANVEWFSGAFRNKQILSVNVAKRMFYTTWASLFRMDIIKNLQLRFKNYKYCEDLLFVTMYLSQVSKIYFMPDKLYNYVLAKDSATTMYSSRHNPKYYFQVNISEALDCYNFYKKIRRGQKFREIIFPRFFNTICWGYSNLPDSEKKQAQSKLTEFVSKLSPTKNWGWDVVFIRRRQFYRVDALKVPYRVFGNKLFGFSIYRNNKPRLHMKLFGLRISIPYQKLLYVRNFGKHKVYNLFGFKLKIRRKFKDKQFSTKDLAQYISNETIAANIIKEVHSKTFPRFKNCNTGKVAVIMASGPTMAYYRPIEGAVHIGMNKSYQNEKVKLDYLFVQDYEAVRSFIDDMMTYPTELFIGSYLSSELDWIHKCIIPERYRDRENVNRYFSAYSKNLCYPYLEYCGLMDFSSVAFPATQFAFYTRPQKIYLVGCDCSNAGYFDKSSAGAVDLSPLVRGWVQMKKYQETYFPDIEIISINPKGLRGVFREVYTHDYVDANPELFEEYEDIVYLEDLEKEAIYE